MFSVEEGEEVCVSVIRKEAGKPLGEMQRFTGHNMELCCTVRLSAIRTNGGPKISDGGQKISQ